MITTLDAQLLLLLKRRQQLETDIKKMDSQSKSHEERFQSKLKELSRGLGLDEGKIIEIWNMIIEKN